jgi:hypothetical protein
MGAKMSRDIHIEIHALFNEEWSLPFVSPDRADIWRRVVQRLTIEQLHLAINKGKYVSSFAKNA